MFGPSDATHWAACGAFLVSAIWIGVTGMLWLFRTERDGWPFWIKTIGIGVFVFLFTPTMIYFAWPAGAQVPPGGVSGNCNNFGNNNFNCNTLNLGPVRR